MPFDAMVVSAAVVAMFAVFAGVVLWGDYQTRPHRLPADAKPEAREPKADMRERRAA
jgi:hypothetical protein